MLESDAEKKICPLLEAPKENVAYTSYPKCRTTECMAWVDTTREVSDKVPTTGYCSALQLPEGI